VPGDFDGVRTATAAAVGGTGAPDAPGSAAEIDQLRDEVAGLRRALQSRPLIEQAKGVLMQRHGWTADHAFHHLVQLSQHLNIRLAELAETVVAEAASPRSVEPTDEAWAYRVLDLLIHPAMTVRPVPPEAAPTEDAVADFDVEYANPAAVDLLGRTADQLVGRRLSKLYPSAPASGILAACVQAWQSASGQVQTMAVPPASNTPTRPRRMMRLRAVPFLDRLLVTW
jgi:PAS domain-containing protein